MEKYYIIITPFFPSDKDFRGSFVFDQVSEIKKNYRGKIIVFKTNHAQTTENYYNYEGIDVLVLPQKRLPSNILPGLFDRYNIAKFNEAIATLEIAYSQIEVIHAHGSNCSIYSNFFKMRNKEIISIVQIHGLDVLGRQNGILKNSYFHGKYLENFYREKYKSIDFIVGVSNLVLQQFELFSGFDNKKLVLYNGVNSLKFRKISDQQKWLKNHIGCVGNLIDIKNQITLLKAFKKLVNKNIDTHLTIVGAGVNYNKLRRYVQKNDLESRVFFIESIKHDELYKFYNQLDIFVLPSYYEAMGCVYVEAFFCGVPFLAVKDQGITEIMFEKEKWTIEKFDHLKLSDLLENFFLNRPVQRITKDLNLKTTVLNFLNYLKIS